MLHRAILPATKMNGNRRHCGLQKSLLNSQTPFLSATTPESIVFLPKNMFSNNQ